MQQTLHLAKKIVLGLLGLFFLVLGLLSVVVPVLPGFIFLIISAACFASISETARLKFRAWYHQYRSRKIPRHTEGLSVSEGIKLKLLQPIAKLLKYLK